MKEFEVAGTEKEVNRMLTAFFAIHSVEVKSIQVYQEPTNKLIEMEHHKLVVSVYYVDQQQAGVLS